MLGKKAMPKNMYWVARMAMGCVCAGAFFSAGFWASARQPAENVSTLLSSGQTVTDEPIAYPAGAPAKVTAIILTLQPGEETGWHTHGVPAFGFMLEGELTVDYGDKGSRIYKSGDAVLEAMTVAHNGRNSGAAPLRILAVFMGAEGSTLSEPARRAN